MKVYVAGPMRGIPNYNLGAFDAARHRLTNAGHQVFCPALLVRAMPYGMQPAAECNRAELTHVIQTDLACLYAADAIALLPGWQASKGATVELALAQFLGLMVLCAETLLPVNPPTGPWMFTVPGSAPVKTVTRPGRSDRPCGECGMLACCEPSHRP